MKRIFFVVALMLFAMGAAAQSGGGAFLEKDFKLFDFPLNTKRLEFGFNVGQAGSFTDRHGFAMGGSLLVGGFYADFLHADPKHKYDRRMMDVMWDDTSAYCINFGYQVPVLKWLRIMPLVGYAQTNAGVTDGSTLYTTSNDDGTSWYHKYKVTPGSREHFFNYGGGLSFQPCKWFSVNLIGTRTAIYGGIGFDIITFARDGK